MDELYKSLEAAKELLNDEIKKITKKGDISPAELENMTKALCAIEKIEEIKGAAVGFEEGDRGMSGRTFRMPNMSYGYYPDEMYGPYGMSGTRRSSTTGRYMSGRSYDHGVSGHSIQDRMISALENMYDEAKTDHERQIVDEWINRLADRK